MRTERVQDQGVLRRDNLNKAEKAFHAVGVPTQLPRFSGLRERSGYYQVPVVHYQATPAKAVELLYALSDVLDPIPAGRKHLHEVQIQYHDGVRKAPYDLYLYRYSEHLDLVFFGMTWWDCWEVLHKLEHSDGPLERMWYGNKLVLSEDPALAANQLADHLSWKDGWYRVGYSKKTPHQVYLMHESRSLKIVDVVP